MFEYYMGFAFDVLSDNIFLVVCGLVFITLFFLLWRFASLENIKAYILSYSIYFLLYGFILFSSVVYFFNSWLGIILVTELFFRGFALYKIVSFDKKYLYFFSFLIPFVWIGHYLEGDF